MTPYRPSVSSPAQLSAPRQLEAEAGVLHQRSTGLRRISQPYLLKYAFDATRSAGPLPSGSEQKIAQATPVQLG